MHLKYFSLFAIFLCCVQCILAENRNIEMKLRNFLKATDAPPLDEDLNETMDMLCTFVQAVVALSTGYPEALSPFPVFGHHRSEEAWSEWSQCSKRCGGGNQWRRRKCEDGEEEREQKGDQLARVLYKVAAKFKRAECEVEERACNAQPCQSSWSEWTSWSSCQQRRTRTCLDKNGCDGDDTRVRSCRLSDTRTEMWTTWEPWSPCSATCSSGGRQIRIRTCPECSKEQSESRPCFPQPPDCATRLLATPRWGSWTECSRSCDGGEQTRACARACRGPSVERRSCNQQPCPGVWSSWAWIFSCSVNCGEGTRMRARVCTQGECVGPSHELVPCVEIC